MSLFLGSYILGLISAFLILYFVSIIVLNGLLC